MALTRITKGVIKPNENYDTHNIVSTGIVTSVGLDVNGNADISGSLSIGGVLTYEDVTSIDSIGIITARSGIDADDFISVGNNIHLGNAGVITATSFVGSGAALTGIDATAIKDSGGNVKIQAQASGAIHSGVSTFQDIDVDGHTNLDNVSVTGFSTFTGSIDVVSTDSGAAAAPILDLIRNSSSAADNDLLGQLRFSGKDDQGSAETYAYITGKILDASAGGEDGILEFTHRKNSSFVITGRWRSDSLQLLNDTNFSVAGDTTLTGDLDVDGHTNLDNVSIAGVVTATSFVGSGANLTGITQTTINNNADNRLITGSGTANTLEGEANLVFNGTKLGVNQSGPYAELDITSSVEDSTGTLAAHGIRLAAVGATDEQVIPITAGFKSQQDRARAGIGFISKISGSSEGYAGAIGFYTKSAADGSGLLRTNERLRIDSAGRCIVGGGTHAGGSALVVKGGNQNTYSTIGMFSNHTNPAVNTLITQIRFGSNTSAVGADIRAEADAAWGTNDYPTRLSFYTTPDGSNSRSERLRITKDGQIRIDQATSANNGIRIRPSGWNYDFRMGAVSSSGGSIWLGQNYEPTGGTRDSASYGTNYIQFTTGGEIHFGTGTTNTNPTARLSIDSSGNISINTGNLTIPDSIIHSGDTDTKIVFDTNKIDLQAAGSSRLYVSQYAAYVQTGYPLAFLSSSGATPNIKSGGTNNQDLLFTTGSGNPTRLQITSDGYVGISESNPRTGLSIGKLGDYPTNDGNTYYMPVGKWSSSWNSNSAIVDNTNYWVGFVGGYHKTGNSVNISLAPNRGNLNAQQGMYISGEATGVSSADFAVGKIIGGSATGSGTSGNVRATKSELFRITSSGQVTKPYTYQFIVESNGTTVSGGWSKLTGLTIDTAHSTGVSNGTYWSNSNQRFTAPVTGTYNFFFGGWGSYSTSTGDRYAVSFKINNGSYKYISGGAYSIVDSPLNGFAISQKLNANDYVELWYYSAGSNTWGGGHRVFWGGILLG